MSTSVLTSLSAALGAGVVFLVSFVAAIALEAAGAGTLAEQLLGASVILAVAVVGVATVVVGVAAIRGDQPRRF